MSSKIPVFQFFEKVGKGHLKMVTIKDGQISLYRHFHEIAKGPGISFQSLALSQKYTRNVCHTAHQYLKKIHFDST